MSIYLLYKMSTFLEIKIKQMTLDDINAELNSGKYISLFKKEKPRKKRKIRIKRFNKS